MDYTHPNDKRCIAGIIKFFIENNIEYTHLSKDISQERCCIECGFVKNLNEFYSSNGKTRRVCKDCVRKSQNKKYHNQKDILNEYKSIRGCAKCGCNKHYLLDFHHIDPTKKDFTVSNNTNVKFETLLNELEKCILLCANCHRELHYLIRTEGIDLSQYLEQ